MLVNGPLLTPQTISQTVKITFHVKVSERTQNSIGPEEIKQAERAFRSVAKLQEATSENNLCMSPCSICAVQSILYNVIERITHNDI